MLTIIVPPAILAAVFVLAVLTSVDPATVLAITFDPAVLTHP